MPFRTHRSAWRRVLGVVVACALLESAAAGQDASTTHAPRATVRAARATRSPVIDGRLGDDAWPAAEPVVAFWQKDPDEGKPATERTEMRVLYDDTALYVGVRLFDTDPSGIGRRLSSRDQEADADQFGLLLDAHHDHLTGAGFVVSAAGVQRDFTISNDTNEDTSWDGVWSSAISVDDQGWTVELRIPFSQLRFTAADRQTWGINAARFIRRKNELAFLELVPKNENGEASRMAHLTGLDDIEPKRSVEVVPYTAARAEYIQPDSPANPFNDGSRIFGSMGLDVKSRVTSSLTLDATLNPDFGQAEVDPAVVNLSAFETFFEEKRRFFIEGSEIFNNFGQRGSNNFFGFNTSDPLVFYSRRIGRAPAGRADGDFVDRPRATTILGAAKLTGKTRSGWSIGLIDAVTSRERARQMTGLFASTTEVEPLTNYFVGRLEKDFSRGGAGLLTTSVVRALDTPELKDTLTSRAFVIGGDGFYYFDKDHEWVVTGKLSGSHISGDEAAIAEIQRAPQRYFQRPDAPEVQFDPQRTSLSGFAGRINLNRNAGVWRVNAALWGVSPGFDSNDLGFHYAGDRGGGHGVLLWRDTAVRRLTRERGAWVAKAWVWNFNRELMADLWFGCANATWRNYWNSNACGALFNRTLDDQLTRGGPKATNPKSGFGNVFISSDGRKRVSLGVNGGHDWNEFGGRGDSAGLSVTVKPLSSLTVSMGPEFNRSKSLAQYVRTEADETAVATFGKRYVFANLDQTQVSLTTRVNYILTPRASLQVFMQPLLATGGYGPFKELAGPRTFNFLQFGTAESSISYDAIARAYSVDPDGAGPAPAFGFDDPDFNFKSLKVNAVLRWEFRGGSTLYVVWTQQREDLGGAGRFSFSRDAAALARAPADDIFLVKLTYWAGR